MSRVLVVCSEPVGDVMAGPAIRALELSRVLVDAGHGVTLAAPAPSRIDVDGVAHLEAGIEDYATLRGALDEHEIVVAQTLPAQLLLAVRRLPVHYVADLHNPLMFEVLEAVEGTGRAARTVARRTGFSVLAQVAAADFIICASEQQRDLWLGGMGLTALVGLDAYRADPTLRSAVDVVPFGLPSASPEPGPLVMKGVWPGIGADDDVLLWGGGLWRWLDPFTPIRAVGRLRAEGRDVHLAFLGVRRPAHAEEAPSIAGAAIAEAERRGLDGRGVHFNPGWVPYAERGQYLLEADLGVTAHLDHLEARFSFRTRVLDYLWAGLPTVSTDGDAMGQLVDRERLGRAVASGDDAAFAAACAELLDHPEARAEAGERIAAVAPRFEWTNAARPLVDFCREPRRRTTGRGTLAVAALAQYPSLLAEELQRNGAGSVLRRVARQASRLVPRSS